MARAIASSLSRKASSKQVGDLRLQFENRAALYRERAEELEAEAGDRALTPTPWGGGLSKDEIDDDEADTDLVQPRFRRGQFAPVTGTSAVELAPEFDEDGI